MLTLKHNVLLNSKYLRNQINIQIKKATWVNSSERFRMKIKSEGIYFWKDWDILPDCASDNYWIPLPPNVIINFDDMLKKVDFLFSEYNYRLEFISHTKHG